MVTVNLDLPVEGEYNWDDKLNAALIQLRLAIMELSSPIKGDPGDDGLSAYQLAQAAGFEGTLDDWLATLIGRDGKSAFEQAQEQGFQGTLSDWLVSLIGDSAYEIWLQEGNTGTKADFLASLKGEPGENGTGGGGVESDPALVPVASASVLARTASKRGVASVFDSVLAETVAYARDTTGNLVLQRGAVNVHPNPTFADGKVGVIGVDGAWPRDMAITTSASGTLKFEILALTPEYIDIKVTRPANATGISNFGFRSSLPPGKVLPSATLGGYATSADLGILSGDPAIVKQVKLAQSTYNPPATTVVAEPSTLVLVNEGVKRVSVWGPVTPGQGVLMGVTVELTGSTTSAIECVLRIGRPQIEDAASVEDVTEFTPGTRGAGTATLRLLPGNYSTLLVGPRGGIWTDHAVTGVGGWQLPVFSGSLPVAGVYSFSPVLTAKQKNAVMDAVAPAEFAPVSPRSPAMRISGDYYLPITPDTPYGFASATNRRSGLYRFEVGPGERAIGDIAAGRTNGRSEVYRIDRPGIPRAMPMDTVIWTSFGLLIEDEPLDGRPFHILAQWHATEDAGDAAMSPLLHLNLTDTGEMQIVCRSFTGVTSTSASQATTTIPYRDPAYPLGVPVNWVFASTFSRSGGGYLQAYRDGVEVVNREIPLGYNDTLGPYFQFGAYLAPSDTNRFAVQYANVETSVASLASRITAPLPIA